MSGGSYDYAYCKIDDFIGQLSDRQNPRRMAFKDLLKLVAQAMHDIEWVDSGDYGSGTENKAIDAVFTFLFKGLSPEACYKAAAFERISELVREVDRDAEVNE